METWTCYLDPFKEKQLIKNDYTGEEYEVKLKDVTRTLFYLYKEKGLKRV